MTQQELGDAMGVTASQISKWESGKINMSRRYSILFKDLFSSMILSPDEKTVLLEEEGRIPTWIDDPDLDPKHFQYSSHELNEAERMLERKEFAEQHRDDPPSEEEEEPEVIEYLMSPTIEEDGYEIYGSSRSEEKGEFVTIRNKEGKTLNMSLSRFLKWRSEGVNPFDKWPTLQFSKVGPKVKKSGFGEYARTMDLDIPTPEKTSEEVKSFMNYFFKDALKDIKPQKFDAWLEKLYSQKGGSAETWGKIQKELDKVPEKKKDQIMEEAFQSQSHEMVEMITAAFSTEQAKPLVNLINEKIKDGVADYQFAAKSEVARLEAMIQKEAKDKVMEYRKEIGVLEAAIKAKDDTIKLLQETIELHKETADLLRQQIKHHKDLAIAGIPEAIMHKEKKDD